MKKLLKVALVAICMLLVGNFAKAQSKIGYIDQNALIGAMPELKTVKTQMELIKTVDRSAALFIQMNSKLRLMITIQKGQP